MKRPAVTLIILSALFWATASQAQIYTVIRKIKVSNNAKYLTLSRDGRNVAYYLVDSDSRPLFDRNERRSISLERGSLWIDNVKVSPDHIYLTPGVFYSYDLTISPDGSKLAYFAAEEGGKWYVWINDKKLSPQFTQGGICIFNVDGSKVAFWGTTDIGKCSMWINENKVSPEFDREGQEELLPVFDNAGMEVAYVLFPLRSFKSLAGRISVWINGRKASPEFEFMFPCVSYDGTSLVYVPKIAGKYSIWKAERRISAEFDLPSGAYPIAMNPVFSRDKTKVAYGVTNHQHQGIESSVWINGVRVSPDAKGIPFLRSFNPDGSKAAYKMAIADSGPAEYLKWSIWINDKKATPEFDEISIASEYFGKTGKLIFAGYDKARGEILIMQSN